MMEVEIKQRDRILEAIDQLRRRKARPDSPRICNYMMRRFNVDCKETKADLQKCVENEIVFKVEYKGDISYRNAAKWNQKHRSGEIIDNSPSTEKKISGSFSKIVSLSISELICQEPDFLELGVPSPQLIKTIIAKSLVKYNKKHLAMLIQKEVEKGGLVKLENGNFSLGSNVVDTDKSDDDYTLDENEIESNSSALQMERLNNSLDFNSKYRKKNVTKIFKQKKDEDNNETEKSPNINQLGFRVGSRKKLAKKVFDPSDNNLPKRKRGRPVGSLNKTTLEKHGVKKSPTRPASVASNTSKMEVSSTGVCCVCHQIKKHCERMISCSDCNNKVHLICLSSANQHNDLLQLRNDQSWQCSQCKSCTVCYETGDIKPLMGCSTCFKAYHYDCHVPKLESKSEIPEQWTCYSCRNSNSLHNVKIETLNFDGKIEDSFPAHSDSSMLSASPPALSPQNRINDNNSNCSFDYKLNTPNGSLYEHQDDSNRSSEQLDDTYDPNIPDASNWTSDDVFQYFSQYFPQEAIVFRNQEIDGHSLLLMKRSDVLTSLNLKLGPALKVYKHVLRLQIRRDDVKLGWF